VMAATFWSARLRTYRSIYGSRWMTSNRGETCRGWYGWRMRVIH
jgi:hypothetical protein